MTTIAGMEAEYRYPPKDDKNGLGSYVKNIVAEDIYRNAIMEKGIAAIHIDVPDFETKMEELLKEYIQ